MPNILAVPADGEGGGGGGAGGCSNSGGRGNVGEADNWEWYRRKHNRESGDR